MPEFTEEEKRYIREAIEIDDKEKAIKKRESSARVICTCCDGDPDMQGNEESARMVTATYNDTPHSQLMCGFCAMAAGASREVYEALGCDVIAIKGEGEL